MTAKEQMSRILESLPEDSSFDELLRELVFERMVEQGIEVMDRGRTLSNAEMDRRISNWANPAGR